MKIGPYLMTGPVDPSSRAISGMDGIKEPEARTVMRITHVNEERGRQARVWKTHKGSGLPKI